MTDTYTPVLTDEELAEMHCSISDPFELSRAVERASIEAYQRQQWQPIETAPKDGTLILLGRAEQEDCPAISVPGYWQEGFDDGVDYMGIGDGFVDVHHQEFSGGRDFGAVNYQHEPNQPTHWQPLPLPPKEH